MAALVRIGHRVDQRLKLRGAALDDAIADQPRQVEHAVGGQLGLAALDQLSGFKGVKAVNGIAIKIQNLLHCEHPTPMSFSRISQESPFLHSQRHPRYGNRM